MATVASYRSAGVKAMYDMSLADDIKGPMLHEIVLRADLLSRDFGYDNFEVNRGPAPDSVPPCGLAIQRKLPPSVWDGSCAEEGSDFFDDLSPRNHPERNYINCIRCFQPMDEFKYFCPHCRASQENAYGTQERSWLADNSLYAKDRAQRNRPNRDVLAPMSMPRKREMPMHGCSIEFKALNWTSTLTTLMIRNIPGQYTPDLLASEWPNNGTYDFLYLPYSSRTHRNLTYCFMNFTSPYYAEEFKREWQKKRLTRYVVQKPLNIGFADVQGRDENLRQLKRKRLLHAKVKECRPLVFKDGFELPLEHALAEASFLAHQSYQQDNF